VDLYAATGSGYYRGTDRVAPYNLYARTSVLLRQARQASKARDIGFRFGLPPPGGRPVRTSRFLEYGSRPPFAESTGSGPALVLRGGEEWQVHWSRPRAGRGTTFTTSTRQRMTFARGQVWAVLAYRSG
jgi:hypothetical protein